MSDAVLTILQRNVAYPSERAVERSLNKLSFSFVYFFFFFCFTKDHSSHEILHNDNEKKRRKEIPLTGTRVEEVTSLFQRRSNKKPEKP